MEQSEYKPFIQGVVDEINDKFLERDELARVLILCLFAQQNIFLFGKPGVGKTDIVKSVSSILSDGRSWETLVNSETKIYSFFGDETISYKDRDLEKTIIGNEIVFLDEMFKAPAEPLNSLLPILNEKLYYSDGNAYPVPLIMAVGASNEMPEGEKIAPFDDRFVFRMEVLRIQDERNFHKFIRKEFVADRNVSLKISKEDVKSVFHKSMEIDGSAEFWREFLVIKGRIIKSGIDISDRKLGRAMDVLRVSAFLNGRQELDYSDVFVLRNIAWVKLEHKKIINRILYGFAFSFPDVIDDRLQKADEEYKVLEANVNEWLFDFLTYNFRELDFNATLEFRFNTIVDTTVKSILAEVDRVAGFYISIKNLKSRGDMIASMIEDNIFVSEVKDITYTSEVIERYENKIAQLYKLNNDLIEWIESNRDFYEFQQNCLKRQVSGNSRER